MQSQTPRRCRVWWRETRSGWSGRDQEMDFVRGLCDTCHVFVQFSLSLSFVVFFLKWYLRLKTTIAILSICGSCNGTIWYFLLFLLGIVFTPWDLTTRTQYYPVEFYARTFHDFPRSLLEESLHCQCKMMMVVVVLKGWGTTWISMNQSGFLALQKSVTNSFHPALLLPHL